MSQQQQQQHDESYSLSCCCYVTDKPLRSGATWRLVYVKVTGNDKVGLFCDTVYNTHLAQAIILSVLYCFYIKYGIISTASLIRL